MKTIDTLWGQWEEQPEPILKKLKEPQLCSIGEHHEIVAHWSYKGTALCDECLQDMADMNSDNAQELLPALKEIAALAGKKLCPFCPPSHLQVVEEGYQINGQECCADCYEVENDNEDEEQEEEEITLPLAQAMEIAQGTKIALTPGWMNDEYCTNHFKPEGCDLHTPFGGWDCMPCRIAQWCESFSQFLEVIADAVYDCTGLIVNELDCIEIEYDVCSQVWKVECEGHWIWIEARLDLNGHIHFVEQYSLDVSDYE